MCIPKFSSKKGLNSATVGYFCSRTESYFNLWSAEARKENEGLHWTIAEMKRNILLRQEKFINLNLSNISFYLIINIISNDPYINIYIFLKSVYKIRYIYI